MPTTTSLKSQNDDEFVNEPLCKNPAIRAKLIKLRKATTKVEKLIYRDLVRARFRAVIIKPDFKSLPPHLHGQLALLSFDLKFPCYELAQILTTFAKLIRPKTPVNAAAIWLIQQERKTPPIFVDAVTGPNAICEAMKAGNKKFFKKLGRAIETIEKPQPNTPKIIKKYNDNDQLRNLRLHLNKYWRPSGTWPGLAYCKLYARMEFLDIKNTDKQLGTITQHSLDNVRHKLGLEPAEHPFISKIEIDPKNSQLIYY